MVDSFGCLEILPRHRLHAFGVGVNYQCVVWVVLRLLLSGGFGEKLEHTNWLLCFLRKEIFDCRSLVVVQFKGAYRVSGALLCLLEGAVERADLLNHMVLFDDLLDGCCLPASLSGLKRGSALLVKEVTALIYLSA